MPMMTATGWITCDACNGEGGTLIEGFTFRIIEPDGTVIEDQGMKPCPECKGMGEVPMF